MAGDLAKPAVQSKVVRLPCVASLLATSVPALFPRELRGTIGVGKSAVLVCGYFARWRLQGLAAETKKRGAIENPQLDAVGLLGGLDLYLPPHFL